MSRALVTGATGQVGSHILERLIADGWNVRALVRDPSATPWLGAAGAEVVKGDIENTASLRTAVSGSDVVFHCAALLSAEQDWPSFQRANIDGTRAVIDAASCAGARLVHMSSVAVYGGAARYRAPPTGEDTPMAPLPEAAYYARSKREAEHLVLGAHEAGRLWATAMRPPVIYGVRDRQFVPRIARVLQSRFFPIFAGGKSTMALVHASAVADGAVRAARVDAAGGRAFNLANDFPVTVAEMVELAAAGLGHRVNFVPVPLPVARAGFAALAVGVRLARGAALASQVPETLNAFSRDNPFSSERARRELGWSPAMRPEIGIPEAFAWWREAHGQ